MSTERIIDTLKIHEMDGKTYNQLATKSPDELYLVRNVILPPSMGGTGFDSIQKLNKELRKDWITLIWENADPSAAFAAQTIPIDLTDYNFFMIECVISTQDNRESSFIYPNIDGISLSLTGQSEGKAWTRYAIVHLGTGIEIDDGYEQVAVGNYVINRMAIRPIRIWGVA